MKKSLLLISAALVASSASFAANRSVEYAPNFTSFPAQVNTKSVQVKAPLREGEEENYLIFTYAGEVANNYALNNIQAQYYIYEAFKMPKEDQAPYIGCRISAVNVMTGTSSTGKNIVTAAEVFVTDDLSVLPEFTEKKLVVDANTVIPVDLTEPYTITGEKDIYIGYRFKFRRECYYIPTDEVVTTAQNTLIGVAQNATAVPSYSNFADEIGSLCLSCTIKGENLPVDDAQVTYADILAYYAPGENLSYDVSVKNFGANKVNSVVVRTSVDNGVTNDFEYTFPTPIAPGEKVTFTVGGIENPSEGTFTLTSSVVKVNDKEIENPVTAQGTYESFFGGFKRRAVIEEFTGIKCGWCPRGIVMMEYLRDHYPDWIRIAVHGYGGRTNEPMYPDTYMNMINKFFSGAPSAITNRIIDTDVAGPYNQYYKPVYNEITAMPTYVKVDFEAVPVEGDQVVKVTATTEFAKANEANKLQLSFVVVEDGVGPYNQSNSYSGGSAGPMGGWESLGSSVSTIYDDVARYLDGYPGIAESIPASVEPNTPYTFEREVPITAVKGERYRLVALVVDPTNGEIVNANEINCGKSAVKSVEGETLDIVVEDGQIIVNGAKNVSIYSLDGRKVAADNLTKGVYIVKADGVSRKVLVK